MSLKQRRWEGRHKPAKPRKDKMQLQSDGMHGKKCEPLGEDWWQTESLISREHTWYKNKKVNVIIDAGERHHSANVSSRFWVSVCRGWKGMCVKSFLSPFWNSQCTSLTASVLHLHSQQIVLFICSLIEVDALLHSYYSALWPLLLEPSPEANPPGVIGSHSVSIAYWDRWSDQDWRVSHAKSCNSPCGATRQLPGQRSLWRIGRGHKQDRLTLPGFASRYTDTNQ